MQEFADAIVSFVRDNESLAVPVAFLVAFGESFCFFSLFWPGTAILVGVAALLAASGVAATVLLPAILAAAFGGILGYALSYWIGLYFKDSIDRVWPFRTHPELIRRGQVFFHKYGTLSVFLGHFFGPVRAVIPVVAGMFAMRQIPFQVANALSAVLWSAGVIAPAFYLVTFKDDVFAFLRDHDMVVASAMFGLAVIYAIPHSLVYVPTLLAFIGLGALYLYADGALLPVLLAGAGGAIVGDIAAYSIGERRRADLLSENVPHGNGAVLARARANLETSGAYAVLWSKFSGVRRSLVPMMAGAISFNRVAFTLASIVSSCVWAIVFLSPRPIAALFGW